MLIKILFVRERYGGVFSSCRLEQPVLIVLHWVFLCPCSVSEEDIPLHLCSLFFSQCLSLAAEFLITDVFADPEHYRFPNRCSLL